MAAAAEAEGVMVCGARREKTLRPSSGVISSLIMVLVLRGGRGLRGRRPEHKPE